jgi:glycosyltransferase involved in cell wall biosynthesis
MSKIKVLTISDFPLGVAGVAHTMREIINSLLKDDKFEICSLGAMKGVGDAKPVKPHANWSVFPIEGFGDVPIYRDFVNGFKPDIILFQSDPRLHGNLLISNNEWRRNVPLVWYTIWDNYPYPLFNKKIWESVDYTVSISKVTEDIINKVCPDVKNYYMPHAVNNEVFKTYADEVIEDFKNTNFIHHKDKFMIFWNNKNARRKNGSTLIDVFGEFANIVGKENVFLLMHTNVTDPDGFNLLKIRDDLGLEDCVGFSQEKVPEHLLAILNNCADVTVNISDNEGFGLNVLESLACGTPVIGNLTGGITEQITLEDGSYAGVGIEPSCKYIIGTPATFDALEVPYIYENRVSNKDLLEALLKMYNMPKEERKRLGKLGQDHVEKNFSYSKFSEFWPEFLEKVNSECGSWPNKTFKEYQFITI